MEFAQPPPNLSMPPPTMMGPSINIGATQPNNSGFSNRPPFKPFMNLQRPIPGPLGTMTLEDFDGKRLRKSVMRKTVDYNSSIIEELENRVWQRDYRDRRALQPDVMYYPDMMPPPSYPDNPINCVTTRFVKTATNKMRCPIFCMAWTPEGRRLVTGASSGEFTLWNGLTFNFETILQAHDSPVRTMVWSHNDSWMVTGDHAGYVKYWQSNMNNVKMFQAHKEALRGISFSPSDNKFVTCSDDGTLRIWDFFRYQEERVLRGHGADVKCVHWHPQKALIISGSKDNQQPIKLWDPKSGQSLATLHAHKSTVMDLKWNDNGNWLITASRDHLLKLFDLRNLSQEVQTFRGHKKEASSVAWHPIHEGLFSSGGSDGSIMFWHVGADKEVGAIEQAHDSIVWTLAWHPLGHILCSGSNDHTSKFWTRNRPGDQMRDKYNLNTLPSGIAGLEDIVDLSNIANSEDVASVIPGMGPEDKVEITSILTDENATIPGLDLDLLSNNLDDKSKSKKVPYSKPIPRNFQAHWNETAPDETSGTFNEVLNQLVENTPGVVPLQKIEPNALIIYGKIIPVEPGSKLEQAMKEGPEALTKYIQSGEIEELHDVMPIGDDVDYLTDDKDKEEKPSHFNPAMQSQNEPFNFDQNGRFGPGGDADMRSMDQDMRPFSNSFHNDSDMRGMGSDSDFRNNFIPQDVDFRKPRNDFMNKSNELRDEDFRPLPFKNENFGNAPYDDDYDENYDDYEDNYNNYDNKDYYDDWKQEDNGYNDYDSRNSSFNNRPRGNRFRGGHQQGSGNFRDEDDWKSSPKVPSNDENGFGGGPSNSSMRGRGGWRGPSRGSPMRGRGMNMASRGRGGPPIFRGAPSSRGMRGKHKRGRFQ